MSAKAAMKSAVDAAMSVAEDVVAGRVAPADLDAQALAECRRLFARVDGPDDPLWSLHVEVGRQLLAVGGWITADELAEWVAVYRAAEGERPAAPSWIEQALAAGADDDEGDEPEV